MESRSQHQSLARRLLGHYLLFGLASIVVLSVGLFVIGQSQFRLGVDEAVLREISDIRSRLIRDLSRNRGTATQALISELGNQPWVASACVVAENGTYLAHSKPTRIGQAADSQFSPGEEGLVERRVTSHNGREDREYLAPLVAGGKSYGSLRVSLIGTETTRWLQNVSDWFPLAIFSPILVLALGALFLRNAIRTVAAIESQLCAMSSTESGSEFRLRPLPEPSAAASGWNRLVDRIGGHGSSTSLETKLAVSIGSLQEKRTDRILNALPEGVAVTDREGCVVYANRAFCVLLQIPEKQSSLRGQPIAALFPAGANLQMTTELESRSAVFEVSLGNQRGGSGNILRVGRGPMAAEDNSAPSQHLWTLRDITQQKLAEETRTQFVYAATHELRTPLANIKAYAETLAMDDISDPEQQKSFLNTINSEATRLARFVEDLLNVSQLEAGGLSLTRGEVDLERLLTEVTEKARPQMDQKGIQFDAQLPVKLPKIHVDKDKFISAVGNLLGNAAKYTPEKGRISFRVTASPEEIQISVEDSGIGIAPDEVPKLFTKFFRSADSRVRDLPGSGLGLAFTQEVVRLHGGKLLVHSELNKGSRFTLTVPAI